MICLVNNEHLKRFDGVYKPGLLDLQLKLEKLSGEPCLERHYTQMSMKLIQELPISALVLSGMGTAWEEYDMGELQEMFQIIREAEVPIIGLCGGHQMIGLAYGAEVGPMRRLRGDENDTYPEYEAGWGYYKERGLFWVQRVKEDPLFEGLGEKFRVMESHYCEVKELPEGFELLASTAECKIQAMKRKDKIVYGVQFHPESFTERYPDGKKILENFFRLVR